MPNCQECGEVYSTLRSLKRHHRDAHPPELWPDDEHLGAPESEQRDFEGEEPDESGHNPEYVAENEPPETEKTSLGEYADE